MEDNIKEVYYADYCKECKHRDDDEAEDKCHECLNEPGRQDTHKPLNFEKR